MPDHASQQGHSVAPQEPPYELRSVLSRTRWSVVWLADLLPRPAAVNSGPYDVARYKDAGHGLVIKVRGQQAQPFKCQHFSVGQGCQP